MTTFVRKLDANGDMQIPGEWITGSEAIAQTVGVRLRLFRGEWFPNADEGIPYFSDIFGVKNPKLAAIRSLLSRAILATPGIQRLDSCDLEFDPETRSLSVSWSATTWDGQKAEDREDLVL